MAINPEQLRNQCLYEAKAPLPTVIEDLEQIGCVIDGCRAFRSKLRRYAGLGLIVALAAAIASAALGLGFLGFVAFVAIVTAIILFIYSFIYSRQIVNHSRRCQLVKEQAAKIQQDAGTHAPFAVRLSLKNSATLASEEPWPVRKNGKQQFFEEEWASLDGRLLDGTAFSHSITELLRKRTYTNPRGKSKTKKRTRYLLSLRLDYPPDRYGDPRAVHTPPTSEIRVPPSTTVKDLRVTEQAIAVKAYVLNDQELVPSTEMLSLAAYQILKSSRRRAAKGGAQ